MKKAGNYSEFQFTSELKAFAVAAAVTVILVAILVLCGWVLDVAVLKSVAPGLVTMKPMTATGLLSAGLALWLFRTEVTVKWQQRLGQCCAGLALLIGGVVLIENSMSLDFGIDRVLFRSSVMAEGGLYPGRPAPSTAFCLWLAGMALLALDAKILWLRSALALPILLVCLLALMGYAYGVSALYQIAPYSSIALHTALSLFILALGLLSARPDPFLSRLTSRLSGSIMARRLLPTAILFPFAVGWLQLSALHAGLYGVDFGWALSATLHILAFSILIYWTANLLNQADVERDTAFSAVRESEERFRMLFNTLPTGVLMVDLDGRIRLANPRSEMLFGFASGQLAGLHIETRIMSRLNDRSPWFSSLCAAALQACASSTGHELSGVRQDGSAFLLQVDLTYLVTHEGKMLLITLIDITERKRTEEDRNRFVALAEASDEFIGMCDNHFIPTYLNPAGLHLVGLVDLAAACAVRIRDFFFPEDQLFINDEFFPKLMREGHAEIEIRFRHFQTGEAIWMLFNVFSLRDTSGEVTGWATVSSNIHERKLLEARLTAIIECAPTAMIMVDGEGGIVLVNSQTETMFGFERHELYNKPVEILIPEKFRDKHPAQRTAYFRAPESRLMGGGRDLFAVRKDGQVFPVEIGIGPLSTPEGSFVLAAIVDISGRKRAEMEWRESEERLRLLVEGVQDYAIIMLDPEGRVVSWNVGAKRINGYEANEIIGQHLSCFYTEEDMKASKPVRELEAAIKYGRFEEDGLRVRKDSSRYWASVILTALRDSTGQLRGFAKVTHDITERKLAEEQILALNAQLEQRVATRTLELQVANELLKSELAERRRVEAEVERFFTMSVDMIAIVGSDGYFHRLNPSFETTLGYTFSELMRTPILDFVHPDDRVSMKAEMTNLAQGISILRFENRYRCKDGSYKWLGWTMQPAFDSTVYAIVRDVTEQKQNEERITASLKEKEVLLKEIHHRVKNNLQVIASLLRLQAGTLSDPAARDLFLDSQRRVRSMALVHEQLYRSNGLSSINVKEYIDNLVSYIRRSNAQVNSNVSVSIDIPPITLDIDQAIPLGLIISELISNSFKHAFTGTSTESPAELWVKLVPAASDGLMLEVGDNGQGIKDDVSIEHPLSMGLHLVNSFILQLHGRLSVQCRPSAVFSIFIPKKDDKGNANIR